MTGVDTSSVPPGLPSWLSRIPLELVERIDLGLEGDWSASVKTVWQRDTGKTGHDLEMTHARFEPAAELYFDREWIGIKVSRRVNELNVVDKELLNSLIAFISQFTQSSETLDDN